MCELMTDQFTLDISSEGKTLSSLSKQDHSTLHGLLNTPVRLDHRKTWYAKMSSIEISKNVDTVICEPYVKKEVSIRVGRMDQCPHTVIHNTQDKIPVTWIGESCVSFDFSAELQTPTLTSVKSVVHVLEHNQNYNRVKLLNKDHFVPKAEKQIDPAPEPERLGTLDGEVQLHNILLLLYGIRYRFIPPRDPIEIPDTGVPPVKIYPKPPKIKPVEPTIKKQDKERRKEKEAIDKQQPWSHVKKEVEKADRPEQYFSLLDVLDVKDTNGKIDFRVIADNPYGVNYAVIRAPTELSYIFGFPYEFSSDNLLTCDPWYFAEGSKCWRIKACGVYGDTRPWDIWSDKNLKIHHFSELCNPLYEVNNVKVITDFTELPLTECKPVITTIPLGAWITDPATKHYHMCIQVIHSEEWKRVISPGSSAISSVKLHLESVSGYPLRVLGENKATRISISFLPL